MIADSGRWSREPSLPETYESNSNRLAYTGMRASPQNRCSLPSPVERRTRSTPPLPALTRSFDRVNVFFGPRVLRPEKIAPHCSDGREFCEQHDETDHSDQYGTDHGKEAGC